MTGEGSEGCASVCLSVCQCVHVGVCMLLPFMIPPHFSGRAPLFGVMPKVGCSSWFAPLLLAVVALTLPAWRSIRVGCHTHTHTHTHTHARMHTQTAHAHVYMYTHTYTHTHTCSCILTRTFVHAHNIHCTQHTHAQASTCGHAHTHAHMCAPTHAHTRT